MNSSRVSIFVKKLGSQESGYSGNRPNQRGKYILVPQESWTVFPHLPETTRNSFRLIRIMTRAGKWIGVRMVYHNTLFHPNLGLTREHNEKRIYRNSDLDEFFCLDRGVTLLLARVSEDSYVGISSRESTSLAGDLSLIAQHNAPIDLEGLCNEFPNVYNELSKLVDTSRVDFPDKPSVENQSSLMEEVQRQLQETPVTDTLADPLSALQAVFRTQVDFAKIVREIYTDKCALRKTALVSNSAVGLEAAHIYPRVDSMNFLPSNGILLSGDLHAAFDQGYWTLTSDLTVEVHASVTDGELRSFSRQAIEVPIRHSTFRPYAGYIEWHRQNIFGKFQGA